MSAHHPIYLDHHATTPCDPAVVAAMLPYFSEIFGNPSEATAHQWGKEAALAVAVARAEVAALVSPRAKPSEIIFTSGATEAINLALKGALLARPAAPRRIVMSAFEHEATLAVGRALSAQGVDIVHVMPTSAGFVTPETLAPALRDGALLVCVMAAQNEIGTIQPLADLAPLVHASGALLFSDAVQAFGKIPLDFHEIGVDLAALSAHKLYGPKGVGALWVRQVRGEASPILAVVDGAGQERGLRGGTLNVPGIVGFGAAARVAAATLVEEGLRLRALRSRLLEGIRSVTPCLVTGAEAGSPDGPEPRLPGNLHLSFPGVEARALLQALPDLACSTGSACASARAEGSHVLRALGWEGPRVFSAVRLGLGRFTTEDDVNRAGVWLGEAARRLREARDRDVNA